jgi:hypothetical protein
MVFWIFIYDKMSTNSSNADENYDINEKTLEEEDNVSSDYEPSVCNCDLCYMSREIYEYLQDEREREREDCDDIDECIENEDMKKEDTKELSRKKN